MEMPEGWKYLYEKASQPEPIDNDFERQLWHLNKITNEKRLAELELMKEMAEALKCESADFAWKRLQVLRKFEQWK